MRPRTGLALAAVLVTMSGTHAQRGAVARRDMPVPFDPGETLTYDVSWSPYLTAGTATVQVVAKKPSYGSTAYYIVAEGRPTPLLSALYALYYKVDTLLDTSTLLPQRASVYTQEGKRRRMKTTMFDRAKHDAEFSVESHGAVRTIAIPADARDPLGALYALRSASLKPGEKMSVPICDDGNAYRVLVRAGGYESVETPLGSMTAQHLTLAPPEASGARTIELWLSTDRAHVPVRMSAQLPVGTFVLTLSGRSRAT
jgi:hypothetical protein